MPNTLSCSLYIKYRQERFTLNKVIDVSSFQRDIDFEKVRAAGIEGVIIRCGGRGYGTAHNIYDDSYFEINYNKIKNAGLPVGAYFYSGAVNETEAREEAQYCLSAFKGKSFEMPVYWDTEDSHDTGKYFPLSQLSIGKRALTDAAKVFLEGVESAGYFTGIYASTSWLNEQLIMSELDSYDVWVAQYYDRVTYTGFYGMWQYTALGSVDGVNGSVDMNLCYRDYPGIIKAAGLNGFVLPGDVDGDRKITAEDARLALRAAVGLEKLTDVQKAAADVDGDGVITAEDARRILRESVGLEG